MSPTWGQLGEQKHTDIFLIYYNNQINYRAQDETEQQEKLVQ